MRSRDPRRSGSLVVAVLLATTACAPGRPTPAQPPPVAPPGPVAGAAAAGVGAGAGAGAADAAEAVAAEAVAAEALRALDEMRWGDVADLVHPMALDHIRTMQLREFRMMERFRENEQRPPDMPEVVWEWFEEQRQRFGGDHGSLLRREYGVESVDELEALSPREFFVRWAEANDPRAQMRRHMAAHDPAMLERLPANADDVLSPRRTVVGAVLADDRVAYVLYDARTATPGPVDQLAVGVLPLHRDDDDRWRLWPSDQGRGLFGPFAVGFTLMEPRPDELAALAERVVVWPDSVRPDGRAWLMDFAGDATPPTGLAIEVTGPTGDPVRVAIPASAFADLMVLMARWAHWE